ncbi:MAG: outer membrane lipoprotein-sorting protein [bacterium]
MSAKIGKILRNPDGWLFVLWFGFSAIAFGGPKDLAYPTGVPDADEIARQVHFVNRFFAFSNASLKAHPRDVALVINRSPEGNFIVNTVERHINNTYSDGTILTKELSVFRDGRLKGTAILLTDYQDPERNTSITMWVPVLRKTQTLEIADPEATWGGTVFTYQEMLPKDPDAELHTIMDESVFDSCLEFLDVETLKNRYANAITRPQCRHKGKAIYKLKSVPKSDNHWFDYRISYIDKKSFADYRVEFFKNGQQIKVVDRDWRPTTLNDPRALQWHHVYGVDLLTRQESLIVVPEIALAINTDKSVSFWTEDTLKNLGLD